MTLHNPPASVLDQGRGVQHKYRSMGHGGLTRKPEAIVPVDRDYAQEAAAPTVADTQELAAAPPAPAKKKRGK